MIENLLSLTVNNPQLLLASVSLATSLISLFVLREISHNQLELTRKQIEPPDIDLVEIRTENTGATSYEKLVGCIKNSTDGGVAQRVAIDEIQVKKNDGSEFKKRISAPVNGSQELPLDIVQFIDLGDKERFEFNVREGKLEGISAIRLIVNSEKLNNRFLESSKTESLN